MTTKAAILIAIRQNCLECSGHQPSEVRVCRITSCDLWPFRFGSDPAPSRNRGFAKAPGYTGDSVRGPASGHPDSPPTGSSEKSPFYTGDSGQRDTSEGECSPPLFVRH
jgi:hypothetical protein